MGQVIRGKNMAVEGESTVNYFEIHSQRELDEIVAGNTDGGMMRGDGNDRWWGFYGLYLGGANLQPARWINDEFTFTAAPDDTGSKAYSGTAKCSGLKVVWDIRNGRSIYAIVSFVCHGALQGGQSSPTDASQPYPITSKGMYCKLDATSYKDLNIDRMELTFVAANQDWYCDSSEDGQIKHTDGDVDGTAEVRLLTDDSSDFPTAGSRSVASFYVNATKYWEVTWMKVLGVLPWRTDRRRKGQAAGIVKLGFTGWTGTQQGTIKDPDATTVWPTA